MSPVLPAFDPLKPHDQLPPLPPAGDFESKAVLRKCIAAGRALATLRQAAALIPNQDVLINSISLREAKDSSAIENIVTTNDRLFRFANVNPELADPATKETLRYRAALLAGYKEVRRRPLTTNTAIMICRAITGIELDVRKATGTVLKNPVTGQVIYTPPVGQALLRQKLANWEKFLHNAQDLDPLIRMAIGHYQFEAIHAFPDGNGRTGRAINILFLIEQDLLDLPILYLSRYINDHRKDYYRLLLDVTARGAWEAWLLYMLSAVEETSLWTFKKIHAIKALMDETIRHVSKAFPKLYSRELVEAIFVQPYCRTANLVAAGIGHRNTVQKYLKELEAGGVLGTRKEGRERLYINTRFLELLGTDANDFRPFAT